MHLTTNKLATNHRHAQGRTFAWMALVSNIGYAGFLTVLPIVLEQKLHNPIYIGYYYSLIAIISFLTSIASTVLVRRISKTLLTKIALITLCAVFLILTVVANIWQFLAFDIIRAVSITLFNIVMAIFVRDTARDTEIALTEGRYYLFANIGWVVGPILGGFLMTTFNKEATFMVSAIAQLVALGIFFHQHIIAKNPAIAPRAPHTAEPTGLRDFLQNVRLFFRQRELLKVFFIAFGIFFWWETNVIYMPLTLKDMGFSETIIGLLISASMLPVVMLEGWIGAKAQKHGVRPWLIFGYYLFTVFALILGTAQHNYIIIALFIIINIAASMVEPLKEVYYFEVVDRRDADRLYGIYNTAYPIAYFLTPLFASLMIGIGGLPFVWIGAGIVFFCLSIVATRIPRKFQAANIQMPGNL